LIGWNSLDNPGQRRRIGGDGQWIDAEEAGRYEIRWVSNPRRGFAEELVATDVVELDKTGPRKGWTASHEGVGDTEVLSVSRDGDEIPVLQGFRCQVSGPSGTFVADDRDRERVLGLIRGADYPLLKEEGSFGFPRDFADAPMRNDVKDGDYEILWSAWEPDDSVGAGPFQYRPVDVARDAFHVDREGSIS
jgi:hypothetical protein